MERIDYVIYNKAQGKFRSNKTSRTTYGTFPMAVVFKHRFQAVNAANEGVDCVVPVRVNIDDIDIFEASVS